MKFVMSILRVGVCSATIFATTLLGGMTAVAVTGAEARRGTALGADTNCFEYRRAEQGFLRKINHARANFGAPPVRLDRELSKVARRHTWEMTNKNLLHHTSLSDFRRRVTNWQLLGENVGVGATVDTLHIAFMKSPGHRSNVLKPGYRHVGVGTRRDRGKLWVTVVFEERTDPGTTLPMPSC